MNVSIGPLVKAESEYSLSNENSFRHSLELVLTLLVSSISDITNGIDSNDSLYSKREHLLSPPVRIINYDLILNPTTGVTYR